MFRPHGIAKEFYEQTKEKGFNLIDLTCPKVLEIHDMVEKYANEDYYIIYIGEHGHPEVTATESFCGKFYTVVETEEDIKKAIENLKTSKKEKVLIIAQTTFNLEKFDQLQNQMKKSITKITLEVKNSICDATRFRQEETKEIARLVEAMIIIGGKKSSNTNKLFDIAKENCQYAVHIETIKELDLEKIKKYQKVGVMAGASTPKESIDDTIKKLNALNV